MNHGIHGIHGKKIGDRKKRFVFFPCIPRLLHATADERNQWRLIGNGSGIHWPELDEDISAENLLLGKPSGESRQSLKCWLKKRKPVD